MSPKDLHEAQQELGFTHLQMASRLGISLRSYYYRLSGDLPIKHLESQEVQRELLARRYALSRKRN